MNIRMYTAAREATTRARNVASAIQQVTRQVNDDNKDIMDKVDKNTQVRAKRKAQLELAAAASAKKLAEKQASIAKLKGAVAQIQTLVATGLAIAGKFVKDKEDNREAGEVSGEGAGGDGQESEPRTVANSSATDVETETRTNPTERARESNSPSETATEDNDNDNETDPLQGGDQNREANAEALSQNRNSQETGGPNATGQDPDTESTDTNNTENTGEVASEPEETQNRSDERNALRSTETPRTTETGTEDTPQISGDRAQNPNSVSDSGATENFERQDATAPNQTGNTADTDTETQTEGTDTISRIQGGISKGLRAIGIGVDEDSSGKNSVKIGDSTLDAGDGFAGAIAAAIATIVEQLRKAAGFEVSGGRFGDIGKKLGNLNDLLSTGSFTDDEGNVQEANGVGKALGAALNVVTIPGKAIGAGLAAVSEKTTGETSEAGDNNSAQLVNQVLQDGGFAEEGATSEASVRSALANDIRAQDAAQEGGATLTDEQVNAKVEAAISEIGTQLSAQETTTAQQGDASQEIPASDNSEGTGGTPPTVVEGTEGVDNTAALASGSDNNALAAVNSLAAKGIGTTTNGINLLAGATEGEDGSAVLKDGRTVTLNDDGDLVIAGSANQGGSLTIAAETLSAINNGDLNNQSVRLGSAVTAGLNLSQGGADLTLRTNTGATDESGAQNLNNTVQLSVAAPGSTEGRSVAGTTTTSDGLNVLTNQATLDAARGTLGTDTLNALGVNSDQGGVAIFRVASQGLSTQGATQNTTTNEQGETVNDGSISFQGGVTLDAGAVQSLQTGTRSAAFTGQNNTLASVGALARVTDGATNSAQSDTSFTINRSGSIATSANSEEGRLTFTDVQQINAGTARGNTIAGNLRNQTVNAQNSGSVDAVFAALNAAGNGQDANGNDITTPENIISRQSQTGTVTQSQRLLAELNPLNAFRNLGSGGGTTNSSEALRDASVNSLIARERSAGNLSTDLTGDAGRQALQNQLINSFGLSGDEARRAVRVDSRTGEVSLNDRRLRRAVGDNISISRQEGQDGSVIFTSSNGGENLGQLTVAQDGTVSSEALGENLNSSSFTAANNRLGSARSAEAVSILNGTNRRDGLDLGRAGAALGDNALNFDANGNLASINFRGSNLSVEQFSEIVASDFNSNLSAGDVRDRINAAVQTAASRTRSEEQRGGASAQASATLNSLRSSILRGTGAEADISETVNADGSINLSVNGEGGPQNFTITADGNVVSASTGETEGPQGGGTSQVNPQQDASGALLSAAIGSGNDAGITEAQNLFNGQQQQIADLEAQINKSLKGGGFFDRLFSGEAPIGAFFGASVEDIDIRFDENGNITGAAARLSDGSSLQAGINTQTGEFSVDIQNRNGSSLSEAQREARTRLLRDFRANGISDGQGGSTGSIEDVVRRLGATNISFDEVDNSVLQSRANDNNSANDNFVREGRLSFDLNGKSFDIGIAVDDQGSNFVNLDGLTNGQKAALAQALNSRNNNAFTAEQGVLQEVSDLVSQDQDLRDAIGNGTFNDARNTLSSLFTQKGFSGNASQLANELLSSNLTITDQSSLGLASEKVDIAQQVLADLSQERDVSNLSQENGLFRTQLDSGNEAGAKEIFESQLVRAGLTEAEAAEVLENTVLTPTVNAPQTTEGNQTDVSVDDAAEEFARRLGVNATPQEQQRTLQRETNVIRASERGVIEAAANAGAGDLKIQTLGIQALSDDAALSRLSEEEQQLVNEVRSTLLNGDISAQDKQNKLNELLESEGLSANSISVGELVAGEGDAAAFRSAEDLNALGFGEVNVDFGYDGRAANITSQFDFEGVDAEGNAFNGRLSVGIEQNADGTRSLTAEVDGNNVNNVAEAIGQGGRGGTLENQFATNEKTTGERLSSALSTATEYLGVIADAALPGIQAYKKAMEELQEALIQLKAAQDQYAAALEYAESVGATRASTNGDGVDVSALATANGTGEGGGTSGANGANTPTEAPQQVSPADNTGEEGVDEAEGAEDAAEEGEPTPSEVQTELLTEVASDSNFANIAVLIGLNPGLIIEQAQQMDMLEQLSETIKQLQSPFSNPIQQMQDFVAKLQEMQNPSGGTPIQDGVITP